MKNFEFKKLSPEDIPLVHSWLSRPHVSEYWSEETTQDLDTFKKKLETKIAAEGVNPYLVVLQGKPIGYIQSYSVDDKTFGIDQFIGVEEFVNKGLGSMFVKEFTDDLLLNNKKVTRIITDPRVANIRAQKAYEKAGFKKLSGKNSFDNDEFVLMEKKIKKAS
ncbi:MAG: acetyltransferase [Bdellovibrionales bacterium]|nr:acetyltransferase [Bdellovibrionales bacterium]